MDNNDSNKLADIILELNSQSGFPLPSRQEIMLLLNNQDMKKMLEYACGLINKHKHNDKVKKLLEFHNLYKDHIKTLMIRKEKENKLLSELKSKKEKLQKLKAMRLSTEEKNRNLLSEFKANDKKRKLAELKVKILSSSKMVISNLLNKLNSFAFIENCKYSQKRNEIKENDDGNHKEFDINTYIEKASALITLNTSLMTQSEMNNNNNATTQGGGIQLPKLSRDELKEYIHLTQNDFWSHIHQAIESLKNNFKVTKENDSLFDQNVSQSQNDLIINNTNDNIEYSSLCKKFLDLIQKEESQLSIDYNDNKRFDYHINVINDNQSLLKAYKIPQDVKKKINSLARAKVSKDIINHLSKNQSLLNTLIEEDEFIIPQCILNDNYADLISYERNLLKTYRKYKLRTDTFISKRILPLTDLLEEKYTDFTNTMRIEIDYFNKMTMNHLKRQNDYSIGKFRYDKETLKAYGVYSRSDLFSYYYKFIDMIRKEEVGNERNKKIIDLIFNNRNYNEYVDKSKLMMIVKEFNESYSFDQRYQLFTDEKMLKLLEYAVKTWRNIDYMNYDIDINSFRSEFD